jgi:hypothetical protein
MSTALPLSTLKTAVSMPDLLRKAQHPPVAQLSQGVWLAQQNVNPTSGAVCRSPQAQHVTYRLDGPFAQQWAMACEQAWQKVANQ